MATTSIPVRERRHFSVQVDGDAADRLDAIAFVRGLPKGRLLSDLIRDAADTDAAVQAALRVRRAPSATPAAS